METANNSIQTSDEYEVDRYTPLMQAFHDSYYGTTDEDDFYSEDLKELHDDIIKVKVEKIWYEHRSVIDQVCITFYLTDDEKIEIELERDYDGHWSERDFW